MNFVCYLPICLIIEDPQYFIYLNIYIVTSDLYFLFIFSFVFVSIISTTILSFKFSQFFYINNHELYVHHKVKSASLLFFTIMDSYHNKKIYPDRLIWINLYNILKHTKMIHFNLSYFLSFTRRYKYPIVYTSRSRHRSDGVFQILYESPIIKKKRVIFFKKRSLSIAWILWFHKINYNTFRFTYTIGEVKYKLFFKKRKISFFFFRDDLKSARTCFVYWPSIYFQFNRFLNNDLNDLDKNNCILLRRFRGSSK